ncbi:unnamed protein product [Rotaria socialis]|uniref:Glucomannan synthase n=1 Tax=Rotaria socialis TaxID=392032 RepID=A0A820YHK0_9BILA|nr:unnamed protein product [Rotaria socialis]CAF3390882.1 unnamed protein product [Rotaria socialis]CAF4527380.1 unnamed protein product [Rotaria socialis]CAF4547915.1 unnamed protein product [Rotaria socialis]
MDHHVQQSILLHDGDFHCIFQSVISNTIVVFTILTVILQIETLFHVCCRLCSTIPVHPKLSDVLPSTACELDYPFVAIQLPMMNEIGCCGSAIDCACSLDWPKSRLLIQVLDDSTDEQTKTVINKCVHRWADRGMRIKIYRRENRKGFKGGNLANGMLHIGQAAYVAIFDVDFLPTKDYLMKTLPILIQDPTVAYVQARWTFTNRKETLLTRMQEIAMNFHHKCEQDGRFRASLFWSFNGTGGVWRTSIIEQIGGWGTDTLVEDFDLSIRAYAKGWRSVYMHDVECLSELPSTVSAYLSQQHRWTSGTIQLARKQAKAIYQSRHISWHKKLYCLWCLFRPCTHFINVLSLVVIMPITIFIPQPYSYNLIHTCCKISTCLCYGMFTIDEFYLILFYIVFSSATSLNNACATISGLFNFNSAKEWTVTPKFGCESNNICLGTTLIEKHSSTLKRDENVSNALSEKNIKQSYSWRALFNIYLCKNHFRWTYQQIRIKLRSFRLYKRNFCMGAYLLVISYLAFEKRAYDTGIYIFSISIMHFSLAFGCMGRQNQQSKHII